MIVIETRQNRYGQWWCNATIKGYDYSFEENSILDAQHEMRNLLSKKDINPDSVIWETPTYYKTEKESSQSTTQKFLNQLKELHESNNQRNNISKAKG